MDWAFLAFLSACNLSLPILCESPFLLSLLSRLVGIHGESQLFTVYKVVCWHSFSCSSQVKASLTDTVPMVGPRLVFLKAWIYLTQSYFFCDSHISAQGQKGKENSGQYCERGDWNNGDAMSSQVTKKTYCSFTIINVYRLLFFQCISIWNTITKGLCQLSEGKLVIELSFVVLLTPHFRILTLGSSKI